MIPNPDVVKAVEQLGYRVSGGDVAAQTGVNVSLAGQELLALAARVGGHMQVANNGEIVYLFPQNLQTILRNKFWQLRLRELKQKVWQALYYLVCISFGIFLFTSIGTISIILFAVSLFTGSWWTRIVLDIFPFDLFLFPPKSKQDREKRHQKECIKAQEDQPSFFEAVFSFLFGDGNPNADLEERRYQEIALEIASNKGAIAGEQIMPYLDDIGSGFEREYEDYMLPVLLRFNGQPVVSKEGHLAYIFPDFQSSATEKQIVPMLHYLLERPERFTNVRLGDIVLCIGLGTVNLGGAVQLGSLWSHESFSLTALVAGDFVTVVEFVYFLLLGYAVGFLSIPLGRFLSMLWRNRKINLRNLQRQERLTLLADETVKEKIAFAKTFAARNAIASADIVYTTEKDLVEQELLASQ